MADSFEKVSGSGPTTGSRQRSQSTVSRVDVEFFDKQGVQELRKTLTRQSAQDQQSPSAAESGITFDGSKGFDFEQVLRENVQK